MKKSIYVYIALIVGVFSCQVDNSNTEDQGDNLETNLNLKLSVRDFQRLIKKPTAEGTILLQSNDNVNTQYVNRSVTISEKHGKGNIRTTSKSLFLVNENNNEIDFNRKSGRSQSKDFLNLYGSTIKVYHNEGETRSDIAEEVYVPQLLALNVNSAFIESGTEISWNVDLLNEDGVIIYVVYDPKLQSDLNLAYNNQSMIIEAFTVSEAQGSYVITDSDLTRFPNDAYLDITIARGAFSLNDSPDNPSFIAISQVTDSKELKK